MRAVVIGSGPNGLCAAIELVGAGFDVRVIEGAAEPGGGCRSGPLDVPGFVHDHCSAIHPMARLSEAITALPLEEHGLRWIDPDAPLAHPFDGGRVAVQARDLGAMPEAWQRAFEPFVRRADELFVDALAPPGIPHSPLLMARLGVDAVRSALSFTNSFDDPDLKALFLGLAGHSVLPLETAGSSAIGLALGIAAHHVGWPFPEGGAGALSRALIGHLESLGGVVETGRWIASLEDLPEDALVLFDTSPAAMVRIAGEALPTRYTDKLARFRHGPGLCKVDYVLDEPIPWENPACARAATVHLGGPAEALLASERACWEGRVEEQPLVLLTQCSLFDSSRGEHTAWAYCHVPAGSDQDVSERIEAQIERFAPGFGDVVQYRHVTTAAGLERLNPNYIGGDVNGGAATLDQIWTRPLGWGEPWATPNPRLFLCSASTPPGGGVHGLCGLHAARSAIRRRTR